MFDAYICGVADIRVLDNGWNACMYYSLLRPFLESQCMAYNSNWQNWSPSVKGGKNAGL